MSSTNPATHSASRNCKSRPHSALLERTRCVNTSRVQAWASSWPPCCQARPPGGMSPPLITTQRLQLCFWAWSPQPPSTAPVPPAPCPPAPHNTCYLMGLCGFEHQVPTPRAAASAEDTGFQRPLPVALSLTLGPGGKRGLSWTLCPGIDLTRQSSDVSRCFSLPGGCPLAPRTWCSPSVAPAGPQAGRRRSHQLQGPDRAEGRCALSPTPWAWKGGLGEVKVRQHSENDKSPEWAVLRD